MLQTEQSGQHLQTAQVLNIISTKLQILEKNQEFATFGQKQQVQNRLLLRLQTLILTALLFLKV